MNLNPSQELITMSVVNVLWRIVAGKRLEYDSAELAELVARVRDVSQTTFPIPRSVLHTLMHRPGVRK